MTGSAALGTEPDASTNVLEVRDLVVRFRNGRTTVHAVNGVSFDLRPGATLGLVGESGCGKSVTSLAILGLLPMGGSIDAGAISLAGRDVLMLSETEPVPSVARTWRWCSKIR
jgi:ABC-type glutathione transport system ATPase component